MVINPRLKPLVIWSPLLFSPNVHLPAVSSPRPSETTPRPIEATPRPSVLKPPVMALPLSFASWIAALRAPSANFRRKPSAPPPAILAIAAPARNAAPDTLTKPLTA